MGLLAVDVASMWCHIGSAFSGLNHPPLKPGRSRVGLFVPFVALPLNLASKIHKDLSETPATSSQRPGLQLHRQ